MTEVTDDLLDPVLALLHAHPAGIGEYALLQHLRQSGCSALPNAPLSDTLNLFRCHFLLFNALYRLRKQLCEQRAGWLEIHTLSIRLLPYQAGTAALCEHDPLRAYYLDLGQLQSTGTAQVDALLQSFWRGLQGGEERQAALALFELADEAAPLTAQHIKHRYRQLVSQHHPDRGGNTARLQAINQAMDILDRYYH